VDDLQLLERMRQADEAAFAELFARYQAPLLRYAVHMCGPTAAEDIVQEAFLALLRQLDRYDAARGSVLGYLLGIARHHAFKRLARSPEQPLDGAGADEAGTVVRASGNPLDELSRNETIERVRLAVGALPPLYRDVVVLCELNELDYGAAAEIMGCPIGTVRSRLHRARALLVKTLKALAPCVRAHRRYVPDDGDDVDEEYGQRHYCPRPDR
jgi:RNA polymerase sigma-70 factor (ECF subfamily)